MAASTEARRIPSETFGRCLLELGSDIDRSPAIAVALDEAIAERVGCGNAPPTLRIWQNGPALVVPASCLRGRAGATVIESGGQVWPVCARGSGGAAVAHGPGTLNLSVILPLRGPFRPSIDDTYRLWISILDSALRTAYGVAVVATPIQGAFCTGSYDVSAAGRKLAGIAQARRKDSVLVHGTILVSVDRNGYLDLIATAERHLEIANADTRYDPARVVSLHELIGRTVSAEELAGVIGRAATESPEGFPWRRQVSSFELHRARQIVEGRKYRRHAAARTPRRSAPLALGTASARYAGKPDGSVSELFEPRNADESC